MKKQRRYCNYCGKEIIKREIEGKIRDYCAHCNTIYYENPLPVASSIVVNEKREVLLVRRKKNPYKDMWCLPIGFAESDEDVRHAALRELKEEAGIGGEIVRLIDVDTVDNYFYGSLVIVTYEVKMTEGTIKPGDDATDARFFPLSEIPPLAWSSNEKAIQLYIDIYRDTWTMLDSFKQLFPEVEVSTGFSLEDHDDKHFLSNVLIKMIDRNIDPISKQWVAEVCQKLPHMSEKEDLLVSMNRNILRGIQYWLKRQRDMLGVEEFIETGVILKKSNITIVDILTLLALSRKSLWLFLIKEKILYSILEIYATLELNNRIIFFYDKIIYNITLGYSL